MDNVRRLPWTRNECGAWEVLWTGTAQTDEPSPRYGLWLHRFSSSARWWLCMSRDEIAQGDEWFSADLSVDEAKRAAEECYARWCEEFAGAKSAEEVPDA